MAEVDMTEVGKTTLVMSWGEHNSLVSALQDILSIDGDDPDRRDHYDNLRNLRERLLGR